MNAEITRPFDRPYFYALSVARRARRVERERKLVAAVVTGGFVNGAKVILRNGVKGKIVKINRSRFKVLATDGRMWNAPPSCMILDSGKA